MEAIRWKLDLEHPRTGCGGHGTANTKNKVFNDGTLPMHVMAQAELEGSNAGKGKYVRVAN